MPAGCLPVSLSDVTFSDKGETETAAACHYYHGYSEGEMPCRYTGHYCLTLSVSCLTCIVYLQSCWCCCLPCPCQAVTDLSGDRPRPPCCRSARRGRSASAGARTCSVTTHCAATSGKSLWRRTERGNWCAPTPPYRGNVYTSQTGSPVALHVQADRVLLYAGSQPGQVLRRRVLLLPDPGGL